jgi:hypothetical protein
MQERTQQQAEKNIGGAQAAGYGAGTPLSGGEERNKEEHKDDGRNGKH